MVLNSQQPCIRCVIYFALEGGSVEVGAREGLKKILLQGQHIGSNGI
jgi:hypothetical protein